MLRIALDALFFRRERSLPMQWRLAMVALLSLSGLFSLPPTSAKADGITIRLDDGLFEREFKARISPSSLGLSEVSYDGNISVTRVNSTTMRVRIPLVKGALNGDVLVDIRASCFSGDLRIEGVDADVDGDNVVTNVGIALADFMFDLKAKLKQEVINSINESIDLNAGECPGVSIESDGSLFLDFGPGTDCTANQVKTEPCSARTVGPGNDYRCANGRWEFDTDNCMLINWHQ